jgi:hypothetical protein
MSLKPGIGSSWFAKYSSDVFPADHVIVRGKECRPPRYYDKLFFKFCSDPGQYDAVMESRIERGEASLDDNTPDRLYVKMQVKLAQISRLQRNLN